MLDSKTKSCCFTGHRRIPPENYAEISRRLEKTLIQLINQGCEYYYAGGALGFDTIAAQTILNLKETYPSIKLILVLPSENQSKNWAKEDKEKYEDIKVKADQIVYTSKVYFRGCMHKRNRYLVDNSDICICYMINETGGTAYTVDYALKKGLNICNIAKMIEK